MVFVGGPRAGEGSGGGALAQAFGECDGGADGGVQGGDGAGQGDAEAVVAAFADEAAYAAAFAADDQGDAAGEVGLPEQLGCAGVETCDPEPRFLEGVEGAGDVGDLDQVDVLHGAGGAFDGGRGEGCGAVFAEHDGAGAAGGRGPDDGSEVVGVFDFVEDDDDGIRRERAAKEGLFVEYGERVGFEKDALMGGAIGEAVEGAAVAEFRGQGRGGGADGFEAFCAIQ